MTQQASETMHPTDDELEAQALELMVEHRTICGMIDADPDAITTPAKKAAAMLRACKGGDATTFENGLNTALKCIASLGYGKNHDVDEGHEEAYRSIERYLDDWKSGKPAALESAPTRGKRAGTRG